MGYGRLAMVLDVLLTLGVSERYLSVKDCERLLAEAGVRVSSRLVRAAFNRGALSSVVAAAEGKGRPATLFYIPCVADLVERFAEGFEGETDVLYPDDLRSLACYRAGLHREFIKRAPGQYSREFLSGRLGVSKNATRAYEVLAGWDVRARFAFVLVDDLLSVPERAERGASWLVASVLDLVEEAMIRQPQKRGEIPGVHLPLCRFVAGKFQRAGRSVYRVTQKCNEYRFNSTTWAAAHGPYAEYIHA